MKIFGHPLHLIFIHFPSALFPMELLGYILFYIYGKDSFIEASFYAMVCGVVIGWIAVLFGIFDLTLIPSDKSDAIKKALIHGGINTSVLMVYTVLAYAAWKSYPQLPDAKLSLLITKSVLVMFLVVGNFLGGSLVLKDKIGTEYD